MLGKEWEVRGIIEIMNDVSTDLVLRDSEPELTWKPVWVEDRVGLLPYLMENGRQRHFLFLW